MAAEETIKALDGMNLILLWRLLEKDKTENASKLMFGTEHSIEGSIEGGDATTTKDGQVGGGGSVTEEVSVTSVVGRKDPVFKMLEDAFYQRKILELWEIDRTEAEKDELNGGKYMATYRRGRLMSWNKSAPADDKVTIELTFAVDGVKQEGYTPLDEKQEQAVQYAFRTTEMVKGEE